PTDVPRIRILRSRLFFFFQAEDGIRDFHVTGVQTCALPIFLWQACDPGTGIVRPLLVLWLTAISGVSVGLLLSVLAKTESVALRSEERRVGKECRCRWAAEH